MSARPDLLMCNDDIGRQAMTLGGRRERATCAGSMCECALSVEGTPFPTAPAPFPKTIAIVEGHTMCTAFHVTDGIDLCT